MAKSGSGGPVVIIKGGNFHLSLWAFETTSCQMTVMEKKEGELDFIETVIDADTELPFKALEWLTKKGIKHGEVSFTFTH